MQRAVLFITHWTIKPDEYHATATRFLNHGAPMPEGLRLVGRFHTPNSQQGWLITETSDLTLLYEHLASWSTQMSFDTTPVLTDEEAAKALTAMAKDQARELL